MPNETFRVRSPRRLVALAVASGRIPESRAEFWEGRLTDPAGPAARGSALFDLLRLHPVLASAPVTPDRDSPLLAQYRATHLTL